MAESTASSTLSIHLNRDTLHSVEIPATFETSESFVVELDNHGEATHVHLRLDETLSAVASLPTSNHYVRPGATTRVPVSVHDTSPVAGVLTVALAYGSQTEEVEITIGPTAGKKQVEIDEALIERSDDGTVDSGRAGATRTNATARSTAGTTTSVGTPVLLGIAALVILLGIVLLFVPGLTLYVGTLAIIVGVIAAAYLLLY